MTAQMERRARSLSGIPDLADPTQPWWRRLLHNSRLWLTVILVLIYGGALFSQYQILHPDHISRTGKVAYGLNNEALRQAAYWAMWTLLAWLFLFVLLDRWRPQRFLVWFWTLGWGACLATWISLCVNSWAGDMMSVHGDMVGAGARPGIFVAPFVEESAKATVLFLLAMLIRYHLVNRLNLVALAGLSAVGFAFTENIIYYARAYVFASNTIEVGDRDKAISFLIMLRGVYTSFVHPLCTAMTAIGVAVALRTRSKMVRILAPIVGFLTAVLLHMLFNGIVFSFGSNPSKLKIPYLIALVILMLMVGFLVKTIRVEGRRINNRLSDFVRMGWLSPRDPVIFSSQLKRAKLIVAALFRGKTVLFATNKLIRAITELAYLRDATTRGLIDQIGSEREKELLQQIGKLRSVALTETKGLRMFGYIFSRTKMPNPALLPQIEQLPTNLNRP